jgi:hypothetical protein
MFGLLGFLAGVLLALFGVFCIFFFPNVTEHQPEDFAKAGIAIGIISCVLAFFLIFY